MILLSWLLGCLVVSPPVSAERRPDCFSCKIKVKSLKRPLELKGRWLFTRDDRPENAQPETDTADWVLLEAPGPWTKAYNDGQYFEVGWYRGNFQFSKRLIGKKAVFYIDAYMSPIQVYQDGKLIMERTGRHTHERFYSIQPIPIVLEITQPKHVISFRIQTGLMVGVYQLPFQLRPYKEFDPTISFYQMFGGEIRNIAAYVILMFGLFFLLIYARTRYRLYQVAGLTGIGIFPFYAFPHDNLVKLFDVHNLWLLHYVGIAWMSLGHTAYSQYFHRFTPRIMLFNIFTVSAVSMIYIVLCFHFHLGVFQIVRKFTFVYSILMATHMIWNVYNGARKDPKVRILFVGEILFWVASAHDILLALGFIKSTSLIFIGTLIATSAILYLTASIFAQTFMQNKSLLKHVEEVNQNLEKTVAIRTHDLFEKTQNLNLVLQSLPEGILTVDPDMRILPEYSRALETILETRMISGRDLFEILFKHSELNSDEIDRVRTGLEFAFGEDEINFDANKKLLIRDYQLHLPKGIKALNLGWSAIVDEAGVVVKILVTVSDVTEVKRLEQESSVLKLRSKLVDAFLDGALSRITDFLQISKSRLEPFRSQVLDESFGPQDLAALYREIHTIKGNARIYDLNDLAATAHEVESDLAQIKRRDSAHDPELMSSYLEQMFRAIQAIDDLKVNVLQKLHIEQTYSEDEVNSKLWKNFRQRWENVPEVTSLDWERLQDDLATLTYRSVDGYFSSLSHGFDDLARSLNKEPPRILVEAPHFLFIDPALARTIQDILVHMIRNSLDHGIEDTETRVKLGKESSGSIIILFRSLESGFAVDYQDDGRGLDLEKIRNRARRLQFAEASSQDPMVVANLIFRHGFSTADEISQVSGRGVGMEVVAQELAKWKAHLQWNRTAEQGRLAFDVTLTFTMGSTCLDAERPQTLQLAL